MDLAPTIFTEKNFDRNKKQEYLNGRASVVEVVETKYDKFLLPEGDRFTKSGLTFGEIDLFSKLHCHANAAYPEVKDGKLARFYQRMSEVPGIKKVTSGASQFGQLSQYLLP